MNWDLVSRNWRVMRGKVRERWGELTDDDLAVIDGEYEQLIGRIQRRYGLHRDDVELEVSDWFDTIHDHA
jgi:uncharacterized protein YjbJ (UPF0337 family)